MLDTNTLLAVIAEINRDIQLMQSKVDRLGALARQPSAEVQSDRGLNDLIVPGEAAKLAKRSKATINRWCVANPIDQPGGFAIWLPSRWHISKSLFVDFLASGRGRDASDETFER